MSPAGAAPRGSEGPRPPSAAPFAWLLALLALPVAGIVPAGPLPTTPWAYLRVVACVVLAGTLLRGGAGRRWGLDDALALLVALVPFAAFGILGLPGVGAETSPGVAVLVGISLSLAAWRSAAGARGSAAEGGPTAGGGAARDPEEPAGGRHARGAGPTAGASAVGGRDGDRRGGAPARTAGEGTLRALALTAIAGSGVLAAAGLRILPKAWDPLTPVGFRALPGGAAAGVGGEAAVEGEDVGLRRGAPRLVRTTPPLARGPGPWLVATRSGSLPDRGPVVLVLDGRGGDPRSEPDGPTFVPSTWAPGGHPLELDAFDALVVLPGAWNESEPGGRRWADAVVTFVRRGGLLVGAGAPGTWPEGLGRRLGPAGHSDRTGIEGARPLGLGRVARAGSQAEVRSVLASDLWVPRLRTAFDRALAAPAAPPGLASWEDEPGRRRGGGLLLLAYAALLGAFERGAGRGLGRWGALLAPVLATVIGLWFVVPGDRGVRAEGVVLDVGGPGGRRVEAVWLTSGPGGYVGKVAWEGGGVVRLLGGHLTSDGRVVLGPGAGAWVVRETVATGGPASGDPPDSRAELLANLLEGGLEGGRRWTGRGAPLAVEIDGIRPDPPWSLYDRP